VTISVNDLKSVGFNLRTSKEVSWHLEKDKSSQRATCGYLTGQIQRLIIEPGESLHQFNPVRCYEVRGDVAATMFY
jgi:hypothetical protein